MLRDLRMMLKLLYHSSAVQMGQTLTLLTPALLDHRKTVSRLFCPARLAILTKRRIFLSQRRRCRSAGLAADADPGGTIPQLRRLEVPGSSHTGYMRLH